MRVEQPGPRVLRPAAEEQRKFPPPVIEGGTGASACPPLCSTSWWPYGTDTVDTLIEGFTTAIASPGPMATRPDEGPFWFHVVLPGNRVATAVPLTTKVPAGDATTSPEPRVIGVWNGPPAGR